MWVEKKPEKWVGNQECVITGSQELRSANCTEP